MKDEHVVGVASYFREEWDALRSLAPDAEVLEDTFDEWAAFYRDSIGRLREAGLRPKRVDIRVHDLLEWCRLQGRRPDGAARSEYTSDVLQRATRSGIILPDA